MAELNHTIVWCSDKQRSADFLTHILGLPPARTFFHFLVVDLKNGVSLDYYQKEGPVARQHYAFLVSDEEFDALAQDVSASLETFKVLPQTEHVHLVIVANVGSNALENGADR